MRCFGSHNPLYAKYHDEEWGVESHDETHLFEMLILEGAQAGLSWEIILKKREGYRQAFHAFDPLKVANMSDNELEALCHNPSIIRNKRKIDSTRQNAKAFLEIQKEFGSFDRYLWGFVKSKPIIHAFQSLKELPCQNPLSEEISKDLRKRGMNFVGPKIIYSYLQAVGVIRDHLVSCPQFSY